jgi:hypothetical protein
MISYHMIYLHAQFFAYIHPFILAGFGARIPAVRILLFGKILMSVTCRRVVTDISFVC